MSAAFTRTSGIALTLHTRALVRSDLRILAMSATLDGGPVAALLGGAPVLTSSGRAYPVETRYRPRRAGGRLENEVAGAVREALAEEPGDVLVFLPGAGEIRRTAELLHETVSADVVSLHGNLSGEEQDRAIRPSPPGRRKVVLATSIAETSLTIEGVKVVIDAGLSRVPRFSVALPGWLASPRCAYPGPRPTSGGDEPVASAPGCVTGSGRRRRTRLCFPAPSRRSWRPTSPRSRSSSPWRASRARAELRWLDPPPEAAFAEARGLLKQLGALDRRGSASPPTAGAWRGWRWLRGWPTWSYGAVSWEIERRPASWPPC